MKPLIRLRSLRLTSVFKYASSKASIAMSYFSREIVKALSIEFVLSSLPILGVVLLDGVPASDDIMVLCWEPANVTTAKTSGWIKRNDIRNVPCEVDSQRRGPAARPKGRDCN